MKRQNSPLWLVILLLSGLISCTHPIWIKMQKRAAVAQGLVVEPDQDVLVSDSFEEWRQLWMEEAEVPAQIRYLAEDSCLDVVAPKGLTLWYRKPFEGDLTFRYQIRAVVDGAPLDRCSDLNSFWMATDPLHPDSISARKDFRAGRFSNYYSLSMYYVGYGGNGNTTTRFRRYDGDYEAFSANKERPAILKEYTDPAHLIRPNHWYSIQISVHKGLVRYWSDGELLFNYVDSSPLRKGWFGIRTTQNHLQVRHFTVSAHQ